MTKVKRSSYDNLLQRFIQKADNALFNEGFFEAAAIAAEASGLQFKHHYLQFVPLLISMYALHTQGVKFDPNLSDLKPLKKEILDLMRKTDELAEKIYSIAKENDDEIELFNLLKQKPAEA